MKAKTKLLSFVGRNLTTIPNLREYTSLIQLDLSDNPIKNLDGLCLLPTLKVLKLDNCQIVSLRGAKNLPSLTQISILNNPITNLRHCNAMLIAALGVNLEMINGVRVGEKVRLDAKAILDMNAHKFFNRDYLIYKLDPLILWEHGSDESLLCDMTYDELMAKIKIFEENRTKIESLKDKISSVTRPKFRRRVLAPPPSKSFNPNNEHIFDDDDEFLRFEKEASEFLDDHRPSQGGASENQFDGGTQRSAESYTRGSDLPDDLHAGIVHEEEEEIDDTQLLNKIENERQQMLAEGELAEERLKTKRPLNTTVHQFRRSAGSFNSEAIMNNASNIRYDDEEYDYELVKVTPEERRLREMENILARTTVPDSPNKVRPYRAGPGNYPIKQPEVINGASGSVKTTMGTAHVYRNLGIPPPSDVKTNISTETENIEEFIAKNSVHNSMYSGTHSNTPSQTQESASEHAVLDRKPPQQMASTGLVRLTKLSPDKLYYGTRVAPTAFADRNSPRNTLAKTASRFGPKGVPRKAPRAPAPDPVRPESPSKKSESEVEVDREPESVEEEPVVLVKAKKYQVDDIDEEVSNQIERNNAAVLSLYKAGKGLNTYGPGAISARNDVENDLYPRV